MAVSMVWASGYRSLIDVRVRLEQVTVVLGENGSGKTNWGAPRIPDSGHHYHPLNTTGDHGYEANEVLTAV